MSREHRFIKIDVKAEIAKNLERLKKAQARVQTLGGDPEIYPPTIDNLMAEGYTLAEALAIIAQWYLDHPSEG